MKLKREKPKCLLCQQNPEKAKLNRTGGSDRPLPSTPEKELTLLSEGSEIIFLLTGVQIRAHRALEVITMPCFKGLRAARNRNLVRVSRGLKPIVRGKKVSASSIGLTKAKARSKLRAQRKK